MGKIKINPDTQQLAYGFMTAALANLDEAVLALNRWDKLIQESINNVSDYNGLLAGVMQHKRMYYFNTNNDPDFKFKKEIVKVYYNYLTNFGNYKF